MRTAKESPLMEEAPLEAAARTAAAGGDCFFTPEQEVVVVDVVIGAGTLKSELEDPIPPALINGLAEKSCW